jgi:hypothetical protein
MARRHLARSLDRLRRARCVVCAGLGRPTLGPSARAGIGWAIRPASTSCRLGNRNADRPRRVPRPSLRRLPDSVVEPPGNKTTVAGRGGSPMDPFAHGFRGGNPGTSCPDRPSRVATEGRLVPANLRSDRAHARNPQAPHLACRRRRSGPQRLLPPSGPSLLRAAASTISGSVPPRLRRSAVRDLRGCGSERRGRNGRPGLREMSRLWGRRMLIPNEQSSASRASANCSPNSSDWAESYRGSDWPLHLPPPPDPCVHCQRRGNMVSK